MASGDAYDVFISYARSDGEGAAQLNRWLRDQHFSTFFDRSALRPGLRWIPALEEAIGRSKAVAILVGKHGIGNTQQYERELALIRQTGDTAFPVIPVLMPGCDSPPTGFLKLLTWVDLSQGASILEQTERLTDLRAAVRGETVAASAVRASICPYRGLEPFREEDAAFFCGRDAAIHELVARVREHPFIAVVGPSGSGKSSLVFAGLLPALRKQGHTTMWDVVTLRPGKWPLRALAEAFGVMPDNAGPAAIDSWLEGEAAAYRAGDKDKLARIVDRCLHDAPEKPDRLLIYVDQWEELYAMAPAPEDKERHGQHCADVERFIELLIRAASGHESRASVVITVRADFYNPLIRNPLLAVLLPKQQVNIPPMSRDDLRSAIETPGKTARLSFAPPQLVDRVLDDVGLEEGRLPLLQFALKETWEKRDDDRLTAEAYTTVGGVARAIERTAQDAYERLSPTQKEAARRLFLRLVTPGEGQEDTRARSAIPDDPQQRNIVALFSNPKTRLLVTALQAAGPSGGEVRATVEVAHEALIQRWPTLREWVRANRENLRTRAAILRAKAEWEQHDEEEKFLLDPGVQLERGRALLANPGYVAVDDIRDYVGRSIEKNQRRLAREQEAVLTDQKRIAAAERLAKEAAEQIIVEQDKALANFRELQVLQSMFLTSQARQQNELGEYGNAVLYALESLPDGAAVTARPHIPEAEVQLRGALRDLSERLVFRHDSEVNSVAFSPRGNRIVTAADDKTARIWDPASGKPVGKPLIGHCDRVISAEFNPDGTRIVTASWDRTARIWDAVIGQPIGEPLEGHEDGVVSAAFSSDGTRIVTASSDRTARIWDAVTGQQIGRPFTGHKDAVSSAAFGPGGRRIVTGSWDKTARVWDVASGRQIGEPLIGHVGAVLSAAFSMDGERVITASSDHTIFLWDVAEAISPDEKLEAARREQAWLVTQLRAAATTTIDSEPGRARELLESLMGEFREKLVRERQESRERLVRELQERLLAIEKKLADVERAASSRAILKMFEGHEGAVWSAAFSPDGQRIVTASSDKTARVWDAASGRQIGGALKGHESAVKSARFDGRRFVTASSDGTVRLWDTGRGHAIGELVRELIGHDNAVQHAAFSPDGKLIVTASWDKTVRVWDAASGKSIGKSLLGHYGYVWSAVFSPDGKRIATASWDKTARIWDAASCHAIGEPLKGHKDIVYAATFSPDGARIVTASGDRTARIWDVASGKPIGEPLRGHQGTVYSAVFSPDGTRIVTTSGDWMACIWDAASGKPIGEPLRGHDRGVLSAMFSPDGKRIVTASVDTTARVWDAMNGRPMGRPLTGHEDTVWSAGFSPDGKLIVTASWDRTVRIWDAASGKPIGDPHQGYRGGVTSAAFSPDGNQIVTASADGAARIWVAAIGEATRKPLMGHQGVSIGAAFSPGGERITASNDRLLRLQAAESGKPIDEPLEGHDDGVISATFSPDGTSSSDGTGRVSDILPDTQALIAQAKRAIPRGLTPAQRKIFFLPPEPPDWCIEMEKWPYDTLQWKQWLVDKRAGKNPPLPAAQ
jgi:WD40 repeat protein/energy-coupling factor transporter ATP-binding protein EcfA2